VSKKKGDIQLTEWWRKKREKHPPPWFDIFEDFDAFEEMMDEMMHHAFETMSKEDKAFRPYVFGFSMSVGPDGKPFFREFGNVQSSPRGHRIQDELEPLVDVMEEKEDIVILAEILGVGKDAITLHATEDHLTISVHTTDRKYHKDLAFPKKVNPKYSRASYKNGVLEVRLKKLGVETVKGEKIRIE
jgi:HSP20 family protein